MNNERTRMTDDYAAECLKTLQDVSEVLTHITVSNDSFAKACRDRGLNWQKTRNMILKINSCRLDANAVPRPLECDVWEPYVRLYRAVTGDSKLTADMLPVDCEATVEHVFNTITERESTVLKERLGLNEELCPLTLEELGAAFNVTRDRIRQIEIKALRKLRHPSRWDILKDGLEVYRARQKHESEIQNLKLEQAAAEHAAVIESMKADHEKRMDAIASTKNRKALDLISMQDILLVLEKAPIDDLELSVRAYNSLKRADRSNLLQLALMEYEDFMRVRNLGRKCIDEVSGLLDDYLRSKYNISADDVKAIYQASLASKSAKE